MACFDIKRPYDLGSEHMVDKAGDGDLWSVIISDAKAHKGLQHQGRRRVSNTEFVNISGCCVQDYKEPAMIKS